MGEIMEKWRSLVIWDPFAEKNAKLAGILENLALHPPSWDYWQRKAKPNKWIAWTLKCDCELPYRRIAEAHFRFATGAARESVHAFLLKTGRRQASLLILNSTIFLSKPGIYHWHLAFFRGWVTALIQRHRLLWIAKSKQASWKLTQGRQPVQYWSLDFNAGHSGMNDNIFSKTVLPFILELHPCQHQNLEPHHLFLPNGVIPPASQRSNPHQRPEVIK